MIDLEIDGYKFDDELIDELCHADGGIVVIHIHDKKLRALMESLGLIHTNIRGSSWGTQKLENWYENWKASS